MSTSAEAERLNSWKAIARHLGCSVRTARRWEADEGLPVHRHIHRTKASVYAYRSELDAWLRKGETQTGGPSPISQRARDFAEILSVAVLPFEFLGPDPSQDYIADGLVDEVINALSNLRSLRVISRTSSMALKGRGGDARTIARQLSVNYLLEGTVRAQDGGLRLSARLIDPLRDDRLWSERFTGTVEDVFTIQERIARRIVEALELQLSAEENRRLSSRPPNDIVAWQCLLQARQESLRWRKDSIDRAIALLERGLDSVGDNPELLAALGRTYLQYREAGLELGEGPLRHAEACAQRVFELDPESAVGRQLRGWIAYSRGQIADAVRHLFDALEVDFNNPETLALVVNCLLISGRVDQAQPYIRHLSSIDPLTPLTRCLPGWAAVLEGDFSAALSPYREMFEMDPDNPVARLFYTWALALNDRAGEAREAASGFPPELDGHPAAEIAAQFDRGLSEATDRAARDLSPHTRAHARQSEMFARFLAESYALAGEAEDTVEWLKVSVDRGFINYPYLSRHDPFLARVRGHEPLESLLTQVRTRWERFDPGPGPAA